MFVLSCPCDDDKESRIVITYAIVVGDGALSVSPEGVEEAVVGTSAGGRGARSQVALYTQAHLKYATARHRVGKMRRLTVAAL